jgi:hypothetical protein
MNSTRGSRCSDASMTRHSRRTVARVRCAMLLMFLVLLPRCMQARALGRHESADHHAARSHPPDIATPRPSLARSSPRSGHADAVKVIMISGNQYEVGAVSNGAFSFPVPTDRVVSLVLVGPADEYLGFVSVRELHPGRAGAGRR